MRAQYNLVAFLFLLTIAVVIVGGVFWMFTNFRSSAAQNAGALLLENSLSKIEQGILELKYMSENSETRNISLTVQVPSRISNQNYQIAGLGNSSPGFIEARVIGSPSIVKQKNITFWNAPVFGAVQPDNGEVMLVYLPTENKIVLK